MGLARTWRIPTVRSARIGPRRSGFVLCASILCGFALLPVAILTTPADAAPSPRPAASGPVARHVPFPRERLGELHRSATRRAFGTRRRHVAAFARRVGPRDYTPGRVEQIPGQ